MLLNIFYHVICIHVFLSSLQTAVSLFLWGRGKRSFTKRQFVVGVPLFLTISIEYFAQKGIITALHTAAEPAVRAAVKT